MSSSRRQRKNKSGTHQFLGTLIVLITGAWLTYHGFSYLVLKSELPRSAGAATLTQDEPTIVARVNPNDIVALEIKDVNGGKSDKPEREMILLAGANRTPVTQAAKSLQPATATPAGKILARANQLLEDGQTIAARKLLNEALADHFDDPAFQAVRDRAIEVGEQTILSLKIYPGDELASYYQIKSGDVLERIARKSNVPYQLLCRINNISDPRRIRVGQKIKLVQGPIDLKVFKHELMMYVFLKDVLFAKYQVGLGKNDKTPVGKWLVEDRILKPAYVDPDTGKAYDGSDPENPTGGYWLRLKGIEGDTIGKTGFGIHGTTEPDSIGKFMSKGCVRMRNEEVAEVFDLLTPGQSEVSTLP
jgi:LysM repeat protein